MFGGSQQRGGRMRKEYLKNNKRVSEGSQRCTRKELRTCYNLHKHMFAAMPKAVCSNTESCLKQGENVLEARRKPLKATYKRVRSKAKKAIREYKKRLGRHKQLLCRFVYGYLKTTETVFDDHKNYVHIITKLCSLV